MGVGYLLDTNVISELRKRNGSRQVRAWVDDALGPTLFISVLTVGEIRSGIERCRARDPRQAVVLEKWLAMLYQGFRDRIVPVTPEIAEEWGRMTRERPLPTVDGLLAATAKVCGWSIVTRNEKDFAGTGVSVINPFSS